MNDTAHFLFIVGTLSTGLIAILIIRAMLPKFFIWFRKTAFPVPKVLASTLTVILLAIFVTSKDFSPNSIYNFSGTINESPYVGLYSPAAATLLATSLTNSLTPAQYRAGFALTAVTNVVWEFSAPANASFCDLGPGVHDEAYWIPLTFNPEGTATNSRWGRAVCATPSGFVLLDDLPDRLSPSFPDLSGAVTNRVLSILQTPSGLLPPAGKLWHAATTNSSHLITWENLFLGRDTNTVANLQLELFQNGDFIYRIQLDEAGDYSAVTNWLIAAQDNGGGEVFAFAEDTPVTQLETNSLPLLADSITANPVFAHLTNSVSLRPQALELRWTAFGDLDPDDGSGTAADTDHDGLSDWDELFVYHTNPGNPDTDADGLWDGEEVNQYDTSPLNSDSDNDGDLDFWQVFSPSSFTNAPWADTDGSNVLFTIFTRLENSSSSSDLAVLRIGTNTIPVLPDVTSIARISVSAGGSEPFILIPGPSLSETATAALTVTDVSMASETTAFPFVDDPSGIFDTSPIYSVQEEQQSRGLVLLAAGGQSLKTPSCQTGKLQGLCYKVTPDLICPHTGRDTVAIQASGIMPLGTSFYLDFNGSIRTSHQITDSNIESPLSTQPGCHEGWISVCPNLLTNGIFLGSRSIDIPAHYCVEVSSNYNPSNCDPNNPAYDPYAVPMPPNSNGNPCGTVNRPHVQLAVGGIEHLPVAVNGTGAYWKHCPYCGCVEGRANDPDTPASLYHKTDGLSVRPTTLTSNGCFVVTALAPSTAYGGDVFTYQQSPWFNRGRYTVLGVTNYFTARGGAVPEAHVAVGVTNALFFGTSVDLPTGSLSITLAGDGKAQFVAYNRTHNRYDVLISPPATNYTCNIADWRDTYRHPTTRQAQAWIMPMSNGLCTLTQSFKGSGNDISVSASASQTFRIHTFLAEPITSETDRDGYVYNPSGIPLGGTAKFKVSLDPMTGFTENDIIWEGAGVTFVNGDNKGSEVTVLGGGSGTYLLTLEVNGLPLVPVPFFFGKIMTPTTAPVTVWIVRDDYGTNAPIAESAIQPIIDDANKILRQKALTLSWNGTANYTNRTEWLDITDTLNPTNSQLNSLFGCSSQTRGVEIYFVKTLDGGFTRGVNNTFGLALASGVEDNVIAHEVLHQCGLLDIYVSHDNVPLSVEGEASNSRLSADWGGGYYPKNLTQAELIRRLIMHGESILNDSNPGIDIPSGRIYGLHYTYDYSGKTNIWQLGEATVGQTDITHQAPEHN